MLGHVTVLVRMTSDDLGLGAAPAVPAHHCCHDLGRRPAGPGSSGGLAAIAGRAFARVAWPAFAVLIVTGAGWVQDELHDLYAVLFASKLVAVALSGLIVWLHARDHTGSPWRLRRRDRSVRPAGCPARHTAHSLRTMPDIQDQAAAIALLMARLGAASRRSDLLDTQDRIPAGAVEGRATLAAERPGAVPHDDSDIRADGKHRRAGGAAG